MSQDQKLPQPIKNAVDELTKKYSESPATTNAGKVLRFVARFVTVDLLLKLLASKKK